jgi:hypothetical protein
VATAFHQSRQKRELQVFFSDVWHLVVVAVAKSFGFFVQNFRGHANDHANQSNRKDNNTELIEISTVEHSSLRWEINVSVQLYFLLYQNTQDAASTQVFANIFVNFLRFFCWPPQKIWAILFIRF